MSDTAHGRIQILHVDDEPEFTDLAATFLERYNDLFSIETATSADEGLRVACDRPPDCIVSDYNMPGTDGIEFLEAVRDEFPDIPFVLFTGKGSEAVASQAISAGVTDYIQKQPGSHQFELLANRIERVVDRYRTEQELERQNDLFAKAQEIAGIGAYEYDVGEEELRWTEQVYEMHGLPTEFDLSIENVAELYHPDDRPKLRAAIDRAITEGEPYDLEVRITPRDGEQRWIRTVADPQVEDGEVVRIRGTVHDVTEPKRREEELGEIRRRFRTLFDQLTQPLVELEYDGLEPVVREVNPAFEETFGHDAPTIIGESLDAYIVPDGHEDEATEINQHVREGGQLVSREVTRQTADGLREFLLENAVYEDGSGGFAIYTDVSDRKRREEALDALHDVTREFMSAQDKQTVADRAVETARTVLDQPINGLWLYDPDDDELQPVAQTVDAAELLGDQPTYASGESLSWQAFQDGELRVYDDVQTDPGRFNAETPIRSEMIIPLGTHGVMNIGAIEPATFSEIDISLARILGKTVEAAMGRANREQRLRRQRETLERQNERLDKFTGVVSHDLRNPLQLATTRIELAQEECESTHLVDATEALERMERLLSDLLTIAREGTQVQETETVSLSAVATEAWTYVETSEATLRAELTHTVRADRGRLRQLLENLLRNAVDHGGDGVTVTIGDLADGFYVADDGPGIPADERDEVFRVGYSTTEDGTGFGLNIVRGVVEAHGWDISVTDSSDGGARFEITGLEVVDA